MITENALFEYSIAVSVLLIVVLILLFLILRQNRNLLKTQLLFLQTQDVAKVGHWTRNGRKNSEKWSDQVYAILERYNQEDILELLNRIINKDDIFKYEAFLTELYETGHAQGDFSINVPQNKIKHIRFEASRQGNDNNNIYGFIQDITSRKTYEKQLIKESEALKIKTRQLHERNKIITKIVKESEIAQKHAEDSDNLKSAFLANISHEIRTPMNGILGFSQLLLRNTDLSGNTRKYLETIFRSSQNLLSVLNSIIDFSMIESNNIEIASNKCSINEILMAAYHKFKHNAEAKELEFYCHTLDDISFIGDCKKIQIVINHLVDNAIKFTRTGRVEFGGMPEGNQVMFYVNDTGMGIEKDDKHSVFEMFVQGKNAINYAVGGTGLGLTISKAYIEKMNGRLWYESTPNKGTMFYFEIPKKQEKTFTEKSPQKEPITIQTAIDYKLPAEILVAEDDITNFEYIKTIFEDTTYIIHHATNGQQAIQAIKQNNAIQLLLLDMKMPEVDGFKAAKIIRGYKPNLPIIALSAHAFDNDTEKAIKAGCTTYMTKPVQPDALLNKVSSLLSLSQTVQSE